MRRRMHAARVHAQHRRHGRHRRAALAPAGAVYSGFSASGLAAFVAAVHAGNAVALGMTTAAILIHTGVDLGGYTWWNPGGSDFDMFVQQGKIMLIP